MIIRVLALTALLVAVSCDTDATNNRQQKILQRRPQQQQASDSIRAGPATPPGPIFRSPPPTPANKPSFSARPKSPPKGGIHPQVEYGFTPISGPNGHAIGADSVQQPSAPVETKRPPLIINVASPPKQQQSSQQKQQQQQQKQQQQHHHQQQQQQKQQQQQQNHQLQIPLSVSYQNSNQGVIEGTFKEKPSFVVHRQQQQQEKPAFVQQAQKTSESQAFSSFSFNQPVGAKINFESDKPKFEQAPFSSIESSYISAGPPKVDKFPPKPQSGPSFPPKEQHTNFSKFPNKPPPPPPSFNKQPPKSELPPFSQKPFKEQFSNFPPPPPPPSHIGNNGKRPAGEPSVLRIPFETKKVVHSPPPPPPPQHHQQPIYRGPPKKQHKPSPNFEIQQASVVGPFSGPPLRNHPQRAQPPPPPPPPPQPKPVAQPPQEARPVPQYEEQPTFVRNPEFEHFPPANFGKGQPIHQEIPHGPQSPFPSPSPQFVQETNPHFFGQSFSNFQQQPQQLPQQQQHHQLQHHQQPQQQQPQFQQTHFGAPSHVSPQLPPQFTQQPQYQLQGGQPQYQLPASFGTQDFTKLSTLNPYLGSAFPASTGASGLHQFGSLSGLHSQRINPALGGLSASGVVSQLGLPSAYPQFNPSLASAAQLYKGILPVQQYPTTAAASTYPFGNVGVNPFLNKATLQSIYPLRSSIPTPVATHSVPGSSVGGVPQFQPLPNSLNFPDEDDEQDSAASQNLKKFIAAPKNNSTKSRKTTLKDILAEDCTGAEDFGYCASPPRYPTQQVKTILKQCKEELEGLFDQTDEHHVSKRDTSAADSTAPAGGEQFQWTTESCSSTTATVEPGYARDSKGHWLVVVQQASSKVHQRVDVDVCGSEGGDCGCKQYYETKNLVSWDPDRPNDCPTVRAFKFPSKCDCPTQNQ